MKNQNEIIKLKKEIDIDAFVHFITTHTDKQVCEFYDIPKHTIKTILKFHNIKLTNEQKHQRFILNCEDKYGMPYDEYIKSVNGKRKETSLERYGTDSVLQSQEVKNKIKETLLERYGVDNPSKSEEVREKVKSTNRERYGVDCNFSSQDTKDKRKKTSLEKYGTENPSQSEEVKDKIKATNLEKYGVENVFQAEWAKEKSKETCLEKYGVEYASQSDNFQNQVRMTSLSRYGVAWPSMSNEVKKRAKESNLKKYGVISTALLESVREKARQTCMSRYGVEHYSKTDKFRKKVLGTSLEKYGTTHHLRSGKVRSKIVRSAKRSSLENDVKSILTNLLLTFQEQYTIQNDIGCHTFDFAVFDNDNSLSILIDCDGLYYHGYISDDNGKSVNPYTDEYRSMLVPCGVKFLCCIEGDIDDFCNQLEECLLLTYDDYKEIIFNWCRQYEFPYPNYDNSVLNKSYKTLYDYLPEKFTTNSRPGMKVIEQFHRSIWKANKYNHKSPYDAWNDDALLKKCIDNRIIYKGVDLYPNHILGGFSASGIAPKVSVFNPYLAKYLIWKYLNQYDTVFDPFSGYSGRMLGACSLGKKYIGQDINPETVKESNQIIDFLNLNAEISCINTIDSTGSFDCVLTCPPYNEKENWGMDIENLSCDQWIDVVLNNYKCKSYLFVVDTTEKYKDNVVESIVNKSHFGTNEEKVILITNN